MNNKRKVTKMKNFLVLVLIVLYSSIIFSQTPQAYVGKNKSGKPTTYVVGTYTDSTNFIAPLPITGTLDTSSLKRLAGWTADSLHDKTTYSGWIPLLNGAVGTATIPFALDNSGVPFPITSENGSSGLPIYLSLINEEGGETSANNIFLDSLATKVARKTLNVLMGHLYVPSANDTLGQTYADSASNYYFNSLYTFGKIIYKGTVGDSCVVENYDTVTGEWYAVGVRSSINDQVSPYIIPTGTAPVLYTCVVPVPRTMRVRRYNVISRINQLAYVRFVANN